MTEIRPIYASDTAIVAWVAQFVKQERLQQNITQAKLAENAGINRGTLSELERHGRCTLLTLVQVLRALDRLDILQEFAPKPIDPTPRMLAEAQAKYYSRKRASRSKGEEDDDYPYPTTW